MIPMQSDLVEDEESEQYFVTFEAWCLKDFREGQIQEEELQKVLCSCDGKIEEARLQVIAAKTDVSVVGKPLGKTPPGLNKTFGESGKEPEAKSRNGSPGKRSKRHPHHRQGKG